ncbi:hypothetical protein [Sinorhizobium psoraleae]|uniref:Uncharacterized protein n=1 Tax=Sinorhizobium psoraleae TaxID=520838 RepID=A0ABT4KAN3_9HYPH|nr:hypothetical protein [Sinorhizobium psoraleae]MCZ4089028.1 hypothetical protein [Sinorhizobium psoraleae]
MTVETAPTAMLPALHTLERVELRFQQRKALLDIARSSQDCVSGFRRKHPVGHALEELDAGFRLDLFQLQGNRRRC